MDFSTTCLHPYSAYFYQPCNSIGGLVMWPLQLNCASCWFHSCANQRHCLTVVLLAVNIRTPQYVLALTVCGCDLEDRIPSEVLWSGFMKRIFISHNGRRRSKCMNCVLLFWMYGLCNSTQHKVMLEVMKFGRQECRPINYTFLSMVSGKEPGFYVGIEGGRSPLTYVEL